MNCNNVPASGSAEQTDLDYLQPKSHWSGTDITDGSPSAQRPSSGDVGHLDARHPVALMAGRLCEGHLGPARRGFIGGVACGACWEQAIRADERVVVLFELPELPPAEGGELIDEIAVDLAAHGVRPVVLTSAERRAAAVLMVARGVSRGVMCERLRMGGSACAALVAKIRGAAEPSVDRVRSGAAA